MASSSSSNRLGSVTVTDDTSPPKPEIRLTALTALALVAAVISLAIAVVYFAKTADALPSFFPGHQTGSMRRHTKHGIAFVGLALLALLGAWLSTAPAATSPIE